jgi:hypothetical protein
MTDKIKTEIINEIESMTGENYTLFFNPEEIPTDSQEAYVQGCQTGFTQGVKNVINHLKKKNGKPKN